MATSLLHFLLFVLLPLILLLPYNASSTSHHQNKLKTLHFSLFQHETVNKTGYFIVRGVTGPAVSNTTTPFGTIFAFQDPMTIAANGSSKVVGVVQGTSITTGVDGLTSLSMATISLNLKHYKGSLSILGGTHNTKPADHPVVGGTGDFMFVQGYVTTLPVDLQGPTFVYKIQFRLYWPPYAM